MPKQPSGSSEKSAEGSGPEQDKTKAGEPAGAGQDQAPADRSRPDQTWAEFCGKLGGQGGHSDPGAAWSQAMLMAVCGPASAMFAANHADALMFYNAVNNQQKTNLLGMAVTAKCVRYMFEAGQSSDDDDIDILEQSLNKE